MQLELVLQIDPHRDTSQIAISMAQFITAIQCDSGKRNLIYDTIRSSASSGIVTLVFRLPALGTHSSEMLQSLIDFATNTAEAFQGASLQRASVATRN